MIIGNFLTCSTPSAPSCTVGYKNCMIEISWTKPDATNDAPVTGYRVSLGQAGSADNFDYVGCDSGANGHDKKCYIQMKQLAESGLYDWFKPTNQIQINVQGMNMHGPGAKCSSAAMQIKSPPPRLQAPSATADGMGKINLNWDSTCTGECWYQIRITQAGSPAITKDL